MDFDIKAIVFEFIIVYNELTEQKNVSFFRGDDACIVSVFFLF